MMILYVLFALSLTVKLVSPMNFSIDLNDSSPEVFSIMPMDFGGDVINIDIMSMKNLFYDILLGYDTRIRPIKNQSMSVNVSTKFVPMSILDFDTVGQKFSVLGYFRVWWKDELLTWNKDFYADTNTIKMPIKEIWTPSLIVSKVSILEDKSKCKIVDSIS